MLDLHFPYLFKVDASKIVDLLQRFHNVKFLTLNLEIIEILSSDVELISHQPSPFVNLKSLKVYPVDLNLMAHKKVKVSTEVKKYLLSSSPSATFTLVSCEEIKAQKLMDELHMLLDQWKANRDTNMTHNKATMNGSGEFENERAELDPKMQCSLGERMTRIKTYWKDLKKQLKERETKIYQISSLLRNIDKILTNVPKKKVMAKFKARFCSLRAEADIIMNNLADCMKFKLLTDIIY